jgi:hypothetical protein
MDSVSWGVIERGRRRSDLRLKTEMLSYEEDPEWKGWKMRLERNWCARMHSCH